MAPVFTRNIAQLFQPIAPAPQHPRQVVRSDGRLVITWIGHATTLIQLDDRLILTDPLFEDAILGISQRLVAPGLSLDEIPRVDATLISHMHFDHLSVRSLDALRSRIALLVVPEGADEYVDEVDIAYKALPPFVSARAHGVNITPIPVRHVGWRYGLDGVGRERPAFSGYAIEYHGLRVFFAGDTAFDAAKFSAASRYGPFDVVLMPIAPGEPRDFMKRTHVDAIEAVAAFKLIGGRFMVPIHYDTFINSADRPGEALARLQAASDAEPEVRHKVAVLEIGEQRVFVSRNDY